MESIQLCYYWYNWSHFNKYSLIAVKVESVELTFKIMQSPKPVHQREDWGRE